MIIDENVLSVYSEGDFASHLYYGSDLIWEEYRNKKSPEEELADNIKNNGIGSKYIKLGNKTTRDIYYDSTTSTFIVSSYDGLFVIDENNMAINKIDSNSVSTACGENGYIIAASGRHIYIYKDGELIKEKTYSSPLFKGAVNKIRYLNNMYIAVENDGGITISNDRGTTWEEVNSNTDENLLDVSYGNGTYAVGGYDNLFIYSKDLVTWKSKWIPHSYSNCYVRSVDYNKITNEFFITTNEYRNEWQDIAYAINADTFERRTLNFQDSDKFKRYVDLRTNGYISIATCHYKNGKDYYRTSISFDNGKTYNDEIRYGSKLYDTLIAIGKKRVLRLVGGTGRIRYSNI